MKIVIAGAGIGGLVGRHVPASRRLRRRGLRGGGRAEAARRRHQHPGRRGAHPVRPRARAGAGRDRHRDPRAALRQPARPDDLGRSARPPCRPAVAAILDPSRRAADDPARGAPRRCWARTAIKFGRRIAGFEQSGRQGRRRASPIATASRRRDGGGRHPDRRRRHPFRGARAVLSRRGAAEVAGHPDVARRHRRQAVPGRRHHGAGRPSHPEVRLLSDQPRPCRARRGADQLDLRPAHGRQGATPPREDWNRPGKLADFLPRFEELELRLARRAGGDPQRRTRSGDSRWSIAIRCRAGAMAASPCWATRRIRCIRSARTAPRRRSSTARRSRRNCRPAAIPSGPAALRAAPPAADRAHRREQPPQGHRRHARHRRAARAAGLLRPRKRAAGRRAGTHRRRLQEAGRAGPRDAAQAGGAPNKKPAPCEDRPWQRFIPTITSPAATEREYAIGR